MDISGKRALVTGASSGIGKSIAVALASSGVNVALLGRDRTRMDEAMQMMGSFPIRTVCCFADVSSEEDVQQAVRKAAEEFEGLDYLINCAGVSQRKGCLVEDIETDEYNRIMRTNVDSVLFCCREVMPYLKESDGAYIINILSTASFASGAGGGVYSASKYAARALHEALEAGCKGSNIRVSAISPGPVNTNIWSHKLEEISQQRKEKMLRSQDIAEIAMFLLRLDPNVHIGNIKAEPWFYVKQ